MRSNNGIAVAGMAVVGLVALLSSVSVAAAQSVVRIGMTAADIPRTLGQPDQGFEGNRFTGLTMYDALTMWPTRQNGRSSCAPA